ncbi:MAG: hypothetical protein WCJ84_03930 [Candidatus Peregrinibacteria bacterium]
METNFSPVEIGALVAGLSELVKYYGVSPKYTPLAAIFFGVAFSVLFAFRAGGDQNALIDAGLSGLLIGLVTAGLYKGGKSMIRAAGVSETPEVTNTPVADVVTPALSVPSPFTPAPVSPVGEINHG